MCHKNSKMHETYLRELQGLKPILCNKGQLQGLEPPSRLHAKFKCMVHGSSSETDGRSACQKKIQPFLEPEVNIMFTVINVYQMEWFYVMPGVPVRQEQKIFLLYTVQTGSGAHPTWYSVGVDVLSRGLWRPGLEVGHSPPSTAQKNEWSYSHPYAFIARTGTTLDF